MAFQFYPATLNIQGQEKVPNFFLNNSWHLFFFFFLNKSQHHGVTFTAYPQTTDKEGSLSHLYSSEETVTNYSLAPVITQSHSLENKFTDKHS